MNKPIFDKSLAKQITTPRGHLTKWYLQVDQDNCDFFQKLYIFKRHLFWNNDTAELVGEITCSERLGSCDARDFYSWDYKGWHPANLFQESTISWPSFYQAFCALRNYYLRALKKAAKE